MKNTIEALTDDLFAKGGWDALDIDRQSLSLDAQKMIAAAVEEAVPVAKLFASEDGQRVLHWLMRKTLLRPPSVEQRMAQSPEAYALAAARREGQNGVIFMILHALQVAHGETAAGGDEA